MIILSETMIVRVWIDNLHRASDKICFLYNLGPDPNGNAMDRLGQRG